MSAGFSRSARDVVVVGVVAAAAVAGLVVWDGGGSPSASPTSVPVATVPATTVAGATTVAAAATTVPGAVTTVAPTTAAVTPGDVSRIPAPAAGVEIPNAPAGTRSWNVLASTVDTVRTDYLAALTAAGWTSAPATAPAPGAEAYRVADPAGGQLTVTITQNGPDVVVVAAP